MSVEHWAQASCTRVSRAVPHLRRAIWGHHVVWGSVHVIHAAAIVDGGEVRACSERAATAILGAEQMVMTALHMENKFTLRAAVAGVALVALGSTVPWRSCRCVCFARRPTSALVDCTPVACAPMGRTCFQQARRLAGVGNTSKRPAQRKSIFVRPEVCVPP